VRRQGIHCGGHEVFGAITSSVNAALIIREYDDNVGLGVLRRSGDGARAEQRAHHGDANDKGTSVRI
jgi:hypothetical protein